MKALITQREATDTYGEPVDMLEARYVTYFAHMGIDVYPVSSFSPHPEALLPDADALILTGGGSLPSRFYREQRPEGTQPHRDDTERRLIARFRDAGKPILAICRGMQYINALWGGKISRLAHLPAERPARVDHPVDVGGEKWLVNQYHNDGIFLDDLADGLEPLAIDVENGVVEAFRVSGEQILALQWHPERPFADKRTEERTRDMIRSFLGQGDGTV